MAAQVRAMKRAMRSILRAVAAQPTLQSTLRNPGYIYAAYVSTIVIEAFVRISGVSIAIQNRFGTNVPFRFPLGPSKIYTSSASRYEIVSSKGTWEMHLCCECEGVSRMSHELDIMLVTKSVADDCRRRRRNPRTDEILFLIECKNVGAVEYGLGREFLGLCLEFPSNLTGSRWTFRENEKSGALVASLTNLPRMPSAFQLVQQRLRGSTLIAEPFVEPAQASRIANFQNQVVNVLRPVLT